MVVAKSSRVDESSCKCIKSRTRAASCKDADVEPIAQSDRQQRIKLNTKVKLCENQRKL